MHEIFFIDTTHMSTIKTSVDVLYKHTPPIPECPSLLQDTLQAIRVKNATTLLLKCKTQEIINPQNVCYFMVYGIIYQRQLYMSHFLYFQAWPLCFEPEDTICEVCGSILGRATSPLGSRGGSWFLCGNGIWSVTTKTRLCENNECRARHSFRDWTSGIRNLISVV